MYIAFLYRYGRRLESYLRQWRVSFRVFGCQFLLQKEKMFSFLSPRVGHVCNVSFINVCIEATLDADTREKLLPWFKGAL